MDRELDYQRYQESLQHRRGELVDDLGRTAMLFITAGTTEAGHYTGNERDTAERRANLVQPLAEVGVPQIVQLAQQETQRAALDERKVFTGYQAEYTLAS